MEICRRLDGMPLAIELAAGRTGALSPVAIARRLDDRFRLLRGGRRGERHQTLRDTVQWSYELLGEAEAALFCRLAVFAGGFTLASAEAVCSDGDVVVEHDVLELLALLVDKSMVQRDRGSEERFTLLETLRQFAEERLDAVGEARLWRERHAAHFSELAADNDRRFFGPDEPHVWASFDAEWDNIRVCSRRRIGRRRPPSCRRTGHGSPPVWPVCDALRARRVGHGGPRIRRAGWGGSLGRGRVAPPGIRAWAAWSSGDYEFAVDECERAIAAGALEPTWWFKNFVGYGRAASARHRHSSRLPHRDRQRASHSGRGAASRRPEGACEEFRQTIEVASAIDPDHMLIDAALDGLAQATAFTGELGEALRSCRDAIESAARYRYFSSLAVALQYGAVALARAGDALVARPASGLRAGKRPSCPRQRRSGGDRRSRGSAVDQRVGPLDGLVARRCRDRAQRDRCPAPG